MDIGFVEKYSLMAVSESSRMIFSPVWNLFLNLHAREHPSS